jgi:hypothetical protein
MSSATYKNLSEELAAILDVISEIDASQSSTEVRRKLVQTVGAPLLSPL